MDEVEGAAARPPQLLFCVSAAADSMISLHQGNMSLSCSNTVRRHVPLILPCCCAMEAGQHPLFNPFLFGFSLASIFAAPSFRLLFVNQILIVLSYGHHRW